MRITIVTGPLYPTPPAPCGAVERIWFDLAIEFARRHHDVVLCSRGHPSQPDHETIGGVRIVRRTRFDRTGRLARDLVKDLAYSARMLPLLPEADVIVTNAFWLPVLARLARTDAGRLVVNVQRYPKRQMFLYGSAARVTTVSGAVRDAIVSQYPPGARRVRVIPNPINVDAFRPPATPRHYEADAAANARRVIAYTGRVHPEKGIHLLVEAFAMLHETLPPAASRGLALRVIGPTDVDQGGGGPEYLAKLRQAAAGRDVEFRPPIYDRDRLADALRDAHHYAYPSIAERGETFGVAPLEAMATGLAPVVSDLACFRDFVEDGRNAFVFDHRRPDAADQLAARLAALITDPARARAAGDAAARTAAQYAIANIASMYLDEFARLLAGDRTEASPP